MPILPPKTYDDPNERRLAVALNKFGDDFLSAVDAACKLRSAPGDTKRFRQYARKHLEDAATAALTAYAYAQPPAKEP